MPKSHYRNQSSRVARAQIDQLESRLLYSTAQVDGTVLNVSGNADVANDILVTYAPAADAVFVMANQQRFIIPAASLLAISVTGGLADDTIRVARNVEISVTLHGAGGNDTLRGGSGTDTLDGGDGDDELNGGGSDDVGPGDDDQPDMFIGGDGADILWTASGDVVADLSVADSDFVVGSRDASDVFATPPTPRKVVPVVNAEATAAQPAVATSAGSIVTWHSFDADNASELVWIDRRENPVIAARRVASTLAARPAGQRSIFLFHVLQDAYHNTPIADIIAKGLPIKNDLDWCRRLFAELALRKAPVEEIVLDVEENISVWSIWGRLPAAEKNDAGRLKAIADLFANPAAYSKLPADVRAATPAQILNFQTDAGRKAVIALDALSTATLNTALKSVVTETARRAFRRDVPVSNYGAVQSTEKRVDGNGWPVSNATPGSISSPVLYLLPSIQDIAGKYKDKRWNALIRKLNEVRGSIAAGADTRPWLSFPGFAGDDKPDTTNYWLWEQLVNHAFETGVSRFYYWNPHAKGQTAPGDEAAAKIFEKLGQRKTTPKKLAPIRWDAEEIVTGELRLTYEDFLSKMGDAN